MYDPSMYASHSSRRSRQERPVHGVLKRALAPLDTGKNPRKRRKKCVLVVERAPALNQRLRRSPTVTSCLLSSPRVGRRVGSRAERPGGQPNGITRTDFPAVLGPVQPLRFAPSAHAATGLTGPQLRRALGNYLMATGQPDMFRPGRRWRRLLRPGPLRPRVPGVHRAHADPVRRSPAAVPTRISWPRAG